MLIGGLWRLGHTISLVAAGILVLLFNFQISEKTGRNLELGVGVMLALLGLNKISLNQIKRSRPLASKGFIYENQFVHSRFYGHDKTLNEQGDASDEQ